MYLPNVFLFQDVKTSVTSLLSALDEILKASSENRNLSKELMQVLPNAASGAMESILGNIATTVNSNIEANFREEDPGWFKGK